MKEGQRKIPGDERTANAAAVGTGGVGGQTYRVIFTSYA
jgi:hypothetical protein